MLIQRERPLAPAVILPPSAPLPSLTDALRRRASIFGPVEAYPAPAAFCGPWRAPGEAVRGVVGALMPRALA